MQAWVMYTPSVFAYAERAHILPPPVTPASPSTAAGPPFTAADIRARTAARRDDIVGWRRHLHRHPELSFEEQETARFIAGELTKLGLDPERPTPTSVTARVRGSGGGRAVGMRADIDALPIHEETGLAFASEVPGVMHACGHDAHTAMLLGAAAILQDLRPALAGDVRLIFQHAEEMLPGGARDLVAAGVVDDVDAVIACHLFPALRVGQIGVRTGATTANADTFTIVVEGRGGHGAMPHLAVDPIVVAAEIVTALQTVASRRVDPMQPVVVSVTGIRGGDTFNVIPPEVTLKGTVRSLHAGVRDAAEEAIVAIATSIAQGAGATARVEFDRGYAASINEPGVTAVVREAAAAVLGADSVIEIDPLMAGDDFAAYGAVRPAAYFFVGTSSDRTEASYGLHNPRFAPDEDALEVGAACMTFAALSLLGAAGTPPLTTQEETV
jgi:amidohydrolase